MRHRCFGIILLGLLSAALLGVIVTPVVGAPQGASPAQGSPPVDGAQDLAPTWTPPQALRRVRTGGVGAPLPEGIVLVRAIGDLRPGVRERSWVFEPDEPGSLQRRAIIVMPASAMEDAAAQLEPLGAAGRIAVEMTGSIFLHRGINYILPGMVVVVDRQLPHERDETPSPQLDPGEVDADEIERRLRERLGPIPRSVDRAEDDEVDPLVALVRESRVIGMRGVVRRDDETGGWRFVPEAAQSSPDQPTFGLLPCALLERLERSARISDVPRTLLVSGEVVRFRDRVFLLPTRVESPRTARALRPGGSASAHGRGQ